jgi:hypothetical protein
MSDESSVTTLVERDEIRVMFKRVADNQGEISRGWSELEAAVGSLRGRKFYGVFDEAIGEYRVCVERVESDEPEALGLEVGTLAGGRYAMRRLRGEPPGIYALIAPAFDQLSMRPDRDDSRLGIEFYRSRDVIDLLLPVT